MHVANLKDNAEAAEALLKALANAARLTILCELLNGERTVTQLHDAAGLSMSAVSQHLAKLRDEAIVSTRRESQTIYYSLTDEPTVRVLNTLYDVFCAPDAGAVAKRGEGSPKGRGKAAL
jgi:ArsR family transcriptional regulator, virulence genes transcriptional regulator